MIKISDWNSVVKYGNKICKDLRKCGYNARLKEYITDDGNKGLYIQVFNSFGNFYKEYASGTYHNNIEGFERALNYNIERIKIEC